MRVFTSEAPIEVGTVGPSWRAEIPPDSKMVGSAVTVSGETTEVTIHSAYQRQPGPGLNGGFDSGIAIIEPEPMLGVLELLEAIDQDHRDRSGKPKDLPLEHLFSLRSGWGNEKSLRTTIIYGLLRYSFDLDSLQQRYGRGPAHIGTDEPHEFYTVSGEPTTEWFDGKYIVPSELPYPSLKRYFGGILGVSLQASVHSSSHAEEDMLLLFDDSKSVHSTPRVNLRKNPQRPFFGDHVSELGV